MIQLCQPITDASYSCHKSLHKTDARSYCLDLAFPPVDHINLLTCLSNLIAMASSSSSLPPDLFDQTTVVSLLATLVLLGVGYGISVRALPASSSGSTRFLFIWHAFDALIHLILEFSFLVNCFFVWIPAADLKPAELAGYYPTPTGFLGTEGRIYGSQAGSNPFAKLWMVYSRADKRWAGSDLVSVDFVPLQTEWRPRLGQLLCSL